MRRNSKLINSFGLFILSLMALSSVNAAITFKRYHLSANEVDFSTSVQDQTVILTLTVDSPIPINRIQSSFDRADGKNIFGGGSGIHNEAIGEQNIEIRLPINAWGGDGQYRVFNIVFLTERDDKLALDFDIFVTVKGTRQSGPPTIDSYDHQESIEAPEDILTILQVTSEAPIEYICTSVFNPNNKNLEGGCGGVREFDGSSIIDRFQIGKCFPEGKYSFTYSVINKALLKSQEISFEVEVTTPNCSSATPAIELKQIESNILGNRMSTSGLIQVSMTLTSTSNLQWTFGSVVSPTGQSIMGFNGSPSNLGPIEVTPVEGDPTKKQYKFTAAILDINYWSYRGIYKFKGLKAENEQGVQSIPQDFNIVVGYPKAPWIEILLEIKEKVQNWQEQLTNIIEEFLRDYQLKEIVETYLQENDDQVVSSFRFLKDSSSDTQKVQLYLGNLTESQFQEILSNPKYLSALEKGIVSSASITSSDEFNEKPVEKYTIPTTLAISNSSTQLAITAFLLVISLCML